MSRILLYGLPRSGTTILQAALARAFDLTPMGELLGNPAKQKPNSIVKVISNHYPPEEVLEISQNYDFTIITQRDDLAACCISLHFVVHTGKFHYLKTDTDCFDKHVEVPLKWHVEGWKNNILAPYRRFIELKKDATIVNYCDIITNNVVFLDKHINIEANSLTRPSNIDYRRLCSNFKEVEDYIND